MSNAILESYIANLAGRTGVAGIATGMLYQQRTGRSFLPYMGKPKVSRGAAEAGGVARELGYEESGPSGPQPTAGDRIEDRDGDGIPDGINIISGTGDTFRVLPTQTGSFTQISQRYDKQVEKEKQEALEKELSVKGISSKLKSLVKKEAGRALGIPDTRFDIASGRDVIASGLKTGLPLIDFAQAAGAKGYEKFTVPKIEAAAAQAALGTEGYGIFTLGGGATVAMTPDGIVGNVDTFLDRTGRTRTQLENELRDKTSAGLGGGYLRDMYQEYTSSPITPLTPEANIKGRYVYEQSILGSTLDDSTKSQLLGFADLRPTIEYQVNYGDGQGSFTQTTTGFAGTVRQDASTGETITSSTPTGTYRDDYEQSSSDDNNTGGVSFSGSDPASQQEEMESAAGVGGGFGGFGSFFSKGGRTRMKEGGTSGDPIQGTGFVSGPPNQFTKGETVADTEYRQVRDGSFVLNAPTVERLQKLGMLPSRVDKPKKVAKIKARKGGLIDVALSKGEVVIEPEDIESFGGYDALERLNDVGKSEVDRRQANMGGRVVGYSTGGVLTPRGGILGTGRIGILGTPFVSGGSSDVNPAPSPPVSSEDSFVKIQPSSPDSYKPFIPELSPFEKLTADLLLRLEGNEAQGYVPKKTGEDLSGVSIGIGFDIGQHSVRDLERMGFNSDIISKFTPYLKKQGDEARAILKQEPLELSVDELAEVNRITLRSKIESFNNFFPEYKDVNDIDRAVLISADWIGGLRPTEDHPEGRYETFKNTFRDTLSMETAIQKGLFARIKNKGDPEHNRAEKALDWIRETRQKMRRSKPVPTPMPRPN